SESDAMDMDDDTLCRLTLLKASEVGFRRQLLSGLSLDHTSANGGHHVSRPLAQMVFCIDVRSERIRRHLEATSGSIATFGFAGFFGLPMEFVPLGETGGVSHVPVLISPQFTVQQEVEESGTTEKAAVIQRRNFGRFLRKAWKEFQTSSASCFSFVESTGVFYGVQLVARSTGWGTSLTNLMDRLADGGRSSGAPALRGLHQQGITTSRQADLAESILRGIGIVQEFGRLVVFCGHSSETENNPLKAGLDCGACGGHSGEPNARLAARLLNQQSIRQSLRNRGIDIPNDTWFVAALHNTTTDTLEFFDAQEIPESHRDALKELRQITINASQHTRLERLSQLPGPQADDLFRRSRDWAEVRPEWGLAGNAAFVAAPRSLTGAVSLDGRVFLHSYDSTNDPEFAVLEKIMTAPLIVAHWINMQYYASTVDPAHMGSGSKTVHNVVGQFGILSGNGGDLMTGLPWQSVHDGTTFRHQPLRLLAVIAAPREGIETIIERHEVLANILSNGWVHLVAVDDGEYFRFTEQRTWDQIARPETELVPTNG
ncbi:MAG: DUF2309 domain-containing protein, partial [Planctomycetaceae bacterium]|nr:DUF2309 domain-containing protein [Planctomycetaceae bacterium]